MPALIPATQLPPASRFPTSGVRVRSIRAGSRHTAADRRRTSPDPLPARAPTACSGRSGARRQRGSAPAMGRSGAPRSRVSWSITGKVEMAIDIASSAKLRWLQRVEAQSERRQCGSAAARRHAGSVRIRRCPAASAARISAEDRSRTPQRPRHPAPRDRPIPRRRRRSHRSCAPRRAEARLGDGRRGLHQHDGPDAGRGRKR